MMRTLITLFCTLCSIQAALAAPRQASCGTGDHLLTDNNGVIKSHAGIDQNHTYGRNLDCIWKIQAPVGMRVELFAKSFDLEDDATCDHDYLLLYDGETSTSLGKFCGRYFKPTLSSGRYMVLQLITNSIIQAGGFSIFYNFTTSNHPHVMCAIDQFECSHGGCIPSAYKCDNADDCGDDSDEQNCDGIALTTCATNHFDCHNPMGCIPVHWVCDGDDDCGNNLDENQEACYELSSHIANISTSIDCGSTIRSGITGTLTSPHYPNAYYGSSDCLYYIQAPKGTQNLTINFDRHYDIAHTDYVALFTDYYGRTNKHGPFNGVTAPERFTMPGDHFFVAFVSDYRMVQVHTGFSMDWKASN